MMYCLSAFRYNMQKPHSQNNNKLSQQLFLPFMRGNIQQLLENDWNHIDTQYNVSGLENVSELRQNVIRQIMANNCISSTDTGFYTQKGVMVQRGVCAYYMGMDLPLPIGTIILPSDRRKISINVSPPRPPLEERKRLEEEPQEVESSRLRDLAWH